MNLREYKTISQRRKAVENELQVQLAHTGNFSLDEVVASTKHCENMIGVTQIPLGVAGPLTVKSATLRHSSGQESKVQSYFIPLATTEGALIASISRGCKVITASGGVSVFVEKKGTTRGPVFYTGSLKKSKELSKWVKTNEQLLKRTAEATSKHLQFKKITIQMLADYVFIKCSFDTADAMGMNMVTIATQKITEVITKKTGIKCLAVAGNFDIDKKPAWRNFTENRGMAVWAEIIIKENVVKEVLKTTSQNIFDVWLGKCLLGSAMSGSLGFNAQYANVIAALFIATGQDLAHVVEGSMGMTTAKVLENGDLFFSIYLPALMIGTVGGGTGLATQKEALEMLGVAGSGKVKTFAEIVAGAVLAGELSLIASLAEGSLARSHQRLGRGIDK